MTTREKACQLSSLRSEHQPCARTVEKVPFLSLNSHLSNYDTRCPKMFPLLIRGKGIRAESCEEDGEEVQWWQWRMAGAQKLHCVSPRSPANAMWVCDWETGSQEPEQHLLSPWKSALSAPVACVPSPEYRLKNPHKLWDLTLCHTDSQTAADCTGVLQISHWLALL